ncbi:MAG TPA: RDD family protein [Chitinophagaceae bacterium]|nr:RDD family protein [Chitinophagaceae bacterium]
MEDNQLPVQQENLFNDEVMYTAASQGQRFINWLIDNILLRIVVAKLTVKILINFLLSVEPEFTYRNFGGDPTFAAYLLSFVFVTFHYLFYYTICEKAFKGYTLGKLLSGTRAIRADGGELTVKDALLRSLSRMVPLEAFSGFSNQPWHDKWTKTTVVKAR